MRDWPKRRNDLLRPRQLRVEQLEERVLLASSASLYATPLASIPTPQDSSHALPAQMSSTVPAEYANGNDSDGSSSPAAQNVIGPQLPTSSVKSGDVNAYPMNADSASARYDHSSSSGDYTDKMETYGTKPVSTPPQVGAGTPLIHTDIAVVGASRASTPLGPSSLSPLTSTAGIPQGTVPANVEPASPAGSGAATSSGIESQGGGVATETPSSRRLEEDSFNESAKEDAPQEEAAFEGSSGAAEQSPLLPQPATALAGLAPLDLQAVEQGMRGIVRRMEIIGKEMGDAALNNNWAPWLAAGLVAAAAFEVALWRAMGGSSSRRVFVVNGWKSSTWTWLPGRSEPPWRENP